MFFAIPAMQSSQLEARGPARFSHRLHTASPITSAALVFVVWPTNSTRLVAVWQREETGLESTYYGEQVTDTEMG